MSLSDAQLLFNVLKECEFKPEKCEWFNLLISQTINKFRSQRNFTEKIIQYIMFVKRQVIIPPPFTTWKKPSKCAYSTR